MPEHAHSENDLFDTSTGGSGNFVSYKTSLVSQGRHRFYTLSIPSEVLAKTCGVDWRHEDPVLGFQRRLDEHRAKEIAEYIDKGFGTIPTSIVLSAQPEAQLEYNRAKTTLRFREISRAFLILDGQHRVYGFSKATTSIRVPVGIYKGLTRTQECKLFIDINTKQRPVPNELLLDIKRMAESETDDQALLRDVFDKFQKEPDSPLLGLMSPAERVKGKISRVTFNAALNAISDSFAGRNAQATYAALGAYVHACITGLRAKGIADQITNPVLFRALLLLFPVLAERVADRHGPEFTVQHFNEVLAPFFSKVKKTDLQQKTSLGNLHDKFKKALKTGFSIGATADA